MSSTCFNFPDVNVVDTTDRTFFHSSSLIDVKNLFKGSTKTPSNCFVVKKEKIKIKKLNVYIIFFAYSSIGKIVKIFNCYRFD